MANPNFEMVGTITLPKDSDKFKSYEENVFSDMWLSRRLKLSVHTGTNNHIVQIESFSQADGKGKVMVFNNPTTEGGKASSEFVAFADRNKVDLTKVPNWAKRVIDLADRNKRFEMKNLLNKKESITDEELRKVGCDSDASLQEAYDASLKLRKEFIDDFDFIDYVKKVIESGRFDGRNFKLSGKVVHQYSERDGICYTSYIVDHIYLADEGEEQKATVTMKVLYKDGCIDKSLVEEKGKYYLDCFTMSRDNRLKKDIPVPVQIVALADNETNIRKADLVVKRFASVEDDKVMESGIRVDIINGTSRLALDESMLTDEQRELLELGLTTMDDLRREIGNDVAGSVNREYRFREFINGYTNCNKDTVYTPDDLVIGFKSEEEEDQELEDLFG